jgi:arylsulfatase A-like enzyme
MKLVRFLYENKDELYNIKTDLGEHHNLAAEQPEKLAEMKAALLAWQHELGIRQLSAKQISTIKTLLKEMRGIKPKASADTD